MPPIICDELDVLHGGDFLVGVTLHSGQAHRTDTRQFSATCRRLDAYLAGGQVRVLQIG